MPCRACTGWPLCNGQVFPAGPLRERLADRLEDGVDVAVRPRHEHQWHQGERGHRRDQLVPKIATNGTVSVPNIPAGSENQFFRVLWVP